MDEERYLGRIQQDMDVCDVNGDKVGTIAQVYRHEFANVAPGTSLERAGEDFIEVKTGFLGLGKRLYIPLSAVRETTEGCVFLDTASEEINGLDWETKPPYLE